MHAPVPPPPSLPREIKALATFATGPRCTALQAEQTLVAQEADEQHHFACREPTPASHTIWPPVCECTLVTERASQAPNTCQAAGKYSATLVRSATEKGWSCLHATLIVAKRIMLCNGRSSQRLMVPKDTLDTEPVCEVVSEAAGTCEDDRPQGAGHVPYLSPSREQAGLRLDCADSESLEPELFWDERGPPSYEPTRGVPPSCALSLSSQHLSWLAIFCQSRMLKTLAHTPYVHIRACKTAHSVHHS